VSRHQALSDPQIPLQKVSLRETEREKLAAALDIFIELNMPPERDQVRAEMEKTTAAEMRLFGRPYLAELISGIVRTHGSSWSRSNC